MDSPKGVIFNIQRFSLHDGPGLRTTVFLKGCPLRCLWCHNPESQSPSPEVMYWKTRCIGCGACAVSCPGGAIELSSGEVCQTGRKCLACGKCVSVCPAGARGISGRRVTAEEVVSEALKDNVFFDESGGGVTFSGGEPLMQPDFLEAALRLSKEAGLMTAVDTCGFSSWDIFEKIIPYSDLFLYDVKHMDDALHRELTGAPNGVILANLRRLARSGKAVIARLPLIPGMNDDERNIQRTGEFLSSAGVREVTVLPYHDMGKEKYERLGRDYSLTGLLRPGDEEIERVVDILRGFGLSTHVSGKS